MTATPPTRPEEIWFAERREAVRLVRGAGAAPAERDVSRYRGLGRTVHDHGASVHAWRSLDPDGGVPAGVPGYLGAHVDAFAEPWPADVAALERLTDAVDDAHRRCGRLGLDRVEVGARSFVQHVACADGEGTRTDVRRYATIGMTASVPGMPGSLRRESAFAGLDDLAAGVERVCDRLAGGVAELAEAGPPVAVPAGRLPVVLAPGSCAQFFHELCGHPLEADVVASGTSYLGWRQDVAVAAEFLTVVDDPSAAGAFAGYAIDDEGVAATCVPLLDRGRVAGPLLDRDEAAALQRPGNGHGRRLSFLFPAVPRQCHTRVLPHAGDEASLVAAVGDGLLVRRLRLRHMNIASGAFSFYVTEGRRIVDGAPGPPVAGLILSGDGLAALAAVDAVGADSEPFMAGGGCGKLDQGPLIVSFEQPSVRLRGLDVRPERVHVGASSP